MIQRVTENRFIDLWRRIGGCRSPQIAYLDIKSKYSNPDRCYHNLSHIDACLIEFDKIRSISPDPDATEMAIWFHDIIYNTRAKDNEERSAEYVSHILLQAKIDDVLRVRVMRLILSTKHVAPPQRYDEQTIVDIDLSILGQPERTFNEYEVAIRREYSWVSEDDFKKERKKILEMFLARSTIYSTKYFYNLYEVMAQANLKRSIDQLSK